MSNIIELIAGNGIGFEANPADGTIKLINSDAIPSYQKAALNNDKANENNKFLTNSEVNTKIDEAMEQIGNNIPPGPNTAPPDFPKLIISSGKFIIPQNGRYRIKFCGGGGGGSNGDYFGPQITPRSGKNGNDTSIVINNIKVIAYGGTGAKYSALERAPSDGVIYYKAGRTILRYDGTKGACGGGEAVFQGYSYACNFTNYDSDLNNREEAFYGGNGAGTGGKSGSYIDYRDNRKYAVNGGGGGGVIAGNISAEDGGSSTYIDGVHTIFCSGGEGGKGYGAGGGGSGVYTSIVGAGGGSGYLVTIIPMLAKNTELNVMIGAGGLGGGASTNTGYSIGKAGNGAQGAVFIEWISGN